MRNGAQLGKTPKGGGARVPRLPKLVAESLTSLVAFEPSNRHERRAKAKALQVEAARRDMSAEELVEMVTYRKKGSAGTDEAPST